MTDPLSVSASAAGVISLTLTVCQGLAAYYGPFAAYSSETESLVTRLKGLTVLIDLLQAKLDTPEGSLDSSLTAERQLVHDRICDCSAGIKTLSDSLNKCRGSDTTGAVTKKGWSYARTLYPFRRGTLVALSNTVLSLQANLNSALEVLQLAISKQVHEQTSMTLTVSRSLAAQTTHISRGVDGLQHGQQQILQTLLDIRKTQQSQESRRRVKNGRYLGQVTGRSTEETLCCCLINGGSDAGFQRQTRCTRCSHHEKREAQTLFKGRFVLNSRLLNFAISFSMATVRDHGGFTLLPALTFRPVVPSANAPAFSVVRQGLMDITDRAVPNLFDGILIQLRDLFEQGRASPGDTLPDGSTLLHVAIRWIMDIPLDVLPEYRTFLNKLVRSYRVPLNEMAGYRQFDLDQTDLQTVLDTLLSAKHFHWPDTDIPNTRLTEFGRIFSDLLDDGAQVTLSSSMAAPQSQRLLWDAHSSLVKYSVNHLFLPTILVDGWNREELPFLEIEIAILQRSEPWLQQLLDEKSGVDMFTSPSPLLAAVSWPPGLGLILQAFHPPYLPQVLEQAIMSEQAESVQILITVGECPISDWAIHLAAVYHYNDAVFRTLADSLGARRRLMLRTALKHIPPQRLKELSVHEGLSILDSAAGRVEEDLRKYVGDSIPGLPRCDSHYPGSSVYHIIGCNKRAAATLYAAGFTDVEQLDGRGQCALFQLHPPNTVHHGAMFHGPAFTNSFDQFLDMCEWFESKGFGLTDGAGDSPFLPVHHVAYWIGQNISRALGARRHNTPPGSLQSKIRRVARDWRLVFSRHSRIIRRILNDTQPRDTRCCPCSVYGCLPANIFVNGCIDGLGLETLLGDVLAAVFDMEGVLDRPTVKEMHDMLAPIALRACTFEVLGLRHTCSYHHPRNYAIGGVKPDDVAEVQAEERLLSRRLAELVLEFEQKYQKLEVSLPEFLRGYWKSRMQEVKDEEQIFDEEEARRMREVGVIITKIDS